MKSGPQAGQTPRPHHGARILATALLLCALAACGNSEQDTPSAATVARVDDGRPVVAGYETMRIAGIADPAARGEILLGELGCLACHRASGSDEAIDARITTRSAPDLSTVGRRATPAWLVAYIADPRSQKAGATMPDLLHDRAAADGAAIAEQLVHFLLRTGGPLESPEHRPFRYRAAVERGRQLFHSIGCVACHPPENGDTASDFASVPLPDLARKTSVAALTRFLLDPAATRPGGRMPSLYLTDDEAADVAVYLLRAQAPEEVDTPAGFEFEYFLDPMPDEDAEGFFDRPPPIYDALTVEASGTIEVLSLDLPVETQQGNHMYRYSGLFPVERAGTYTFVLSSDRRSGSELLLNAVPVATKDRDTGREISAEVELQAGDHALAVTYYIRGDTEEPYLRVTVSRGDETAIPLDRVVLYEDVRLRPTVAASLEIDDAAAAQGALRFIEIGCSSCHALGERPLDVGPGAAPLVELSPGAGPWHVAAGTPRYGLADHQRRAIAAALGDRERLASARGPEDAVTHALGTYNCYACHRRGDDAGSGGGPDAGRDPWFKAVPGQDVGEEGRLPPDLTAIGSKLRQGAMHSILTEERLHVRRHYMQTRMPRFAGAPVQALAAALDASDARPGDLDEPPFTAEAIEDGRELVGDDGLRCITCHDVGVHPAQGVSAINMAHFYERVRPGYVARWLSEPQAIRPGTRMPSFWPGGSVVHPDIADGTMEGQIDAIYSYVSLGSSMPTPTGMDIGDSLVLAPTDEPVVFRTFMTDVSPRAIVVGYPEMVHVAFDANVMRLAKAWRGGFYDAQGTWSGRAGRFLNPYGDEVINLPPGPALAFLSSADAPWPPVTLSDRNTGGRFMGYRLDEQRRPIFMYRLGGVMVEERPVPVTRPGGSGLIRSFALEAGRLSGNLYLLLGEGDEITANADGSWTIDGQLRIAVPADLATDAFVRSSQGVRQLLLPLSITSSQSVSIDVEITW